MESVNIRWIRCAQANAAEKLAELRRQLSSQADVVSERGRQLTQAVFGEPLPPAKVVERICADVKSRGLEALLHYTEQFDGIRHDAASLRVSAEELQSAHEAAEPAFKETIRRVRFNIMSFQLGLLHSDAVLNVAGQHELRLRYRPLRRVGVCIPGGQRRIHPPF